MTIKKKKILSVVVSLGLFCMVPIAWGAGQLTGTVTQKLGNRVKVDFTPDKSLAPSPGDQVSFTKMLKKRELKAGKGEVVEVGSGFAWVRITKKPVQLRMTGKITATGTLALTHEQKAGREQVNQTEKMKIWEIPYDSTGKTGLTLEMPEDWDYDPSVDKGWTLFKPKARDDYDLHVHVGVTKTTKPLQSPQTLKNGLINEIEKENTFITAILVAPRSVMAGGKEALYTAVSGNGEGDGGFPFIKDGVWRLYDIEFVDRGRKVNVNALCEVKTCNTTREKLMQRIINSVEFFKMFSLFWSSGSP